MCKSVFVYSMGCMCLDMLSDVCIQATVEQEAGLREVKDMVLLILHVLAEPYSECYHIVY